MYDLTAWGRDLEVVNAALSRWAVRSPQLPLEADMGPDALVLAMRAHAQPLPRGAKGHRVALKLTDSRTPERDPVNYLATLATCGTSIEKAVPSDPVDAVISATTRTWKAIVIGGVALRDCEDVTISGEVAAAHALLEVCALHAVAF
ncbi:hypothetical protein BH23ACT6_BH23ACT6_20380 [soil metagenome]